MTDPVQLEPYAEHTPVMRQYLTLRDQHPGVMLLYRLGDFYETFFEDAQRISKLLGLTLTHRGKDRQGTPIPMAGVPAATLEQYLARLVRCGVSVAICEQMGEATGRGMIERRIARIVTPGTLTDQSLLNDKTDCSLLAYAPASKKHHDAALVWLTLSSGVFRALKCPDEEVPSHLARIAPSEILVAESHRDQLAQLEMKTSLTALPDWHFDAVRGAAQIEERFGLEGLTARGLRHEADILAAANAILGYVEQTQCEALPFIRALEIENESSFVALDASTRRNLELTETLRGDDGPTLFGVLDTCNTSMGSRLMRYWLHHPLRNRSEASARHSAVAALLADTTFEERLREALTVVPDIERMASRIALRSIRSKELAALRDALPHIEAIARAAAGSDNALIAKLGAQARIDAALGQDLQRTLLEEPAAQLRDGDVIDSRCDEELAQARQMRDNTGDFLTELEMRERTATGIAQLRVEYNRVSGYYIEVPRSQAQHVPESYRRRQTLKNVERYVNPELKAYEDQALSAQERAAQLERRLWEALVERCNVYVASLMAASGALAELDVLDAFARHALAARWVQPTLGTTPGIVIEQGRHPVVEHMLEHYVPNDCRLQPGRRLMILTGPNMGGKSTYMRSVALIALLAYAGSFVPAQSATLGPIDKILTRIGASDDLARGRSTFMVEMTEAAAILHEATDQSLVLMDEIGRGTSTFDGLSLAAAIARELAETTRSWTLFATHYFELTQLAGQCRETVNAHVSAQETPKGIVFLHDITEGPANQSYGLAVAHLAGMPARVLRRAKSVLAELEQRAEAKGPQMDLFAAPAVDAPHEEPVAEMSPALQALLESLVQLEPDALTPRQALDVLYALREKTQQLPEVRAAGAIEALKAKD